MTQSSPSHKFPAKDTQKASDAKRAEANGNNDALTRALQQSFQATVDEGVPDTLMDLINKLK